MPIVGTPTSGDAISDYTTKASVQASYGVDNTNAYFSLEGRLDADQTAAAWLKAGQNTDADIRNTWRARTHNAGVTYAAPDPATMNADDAIFLSETADMGIVFRGYRSRGMSDTNQPGTENPQDGKMAGIWKEYQRRLAAIASGHALTALQTAAGITRATRVPVLPDRVNTDPDTDSNGYRTAPCLPRFWW